MSSTVPQRPLGSQGLVASAQGLGCMGITAFYTKGMEGVSKEDRQAEGLRTIKAALDQGINLLDTAWIYQDFATGETNEELVGRALKEFGRDKFVLCTKFGITAQGPDSSEATIREQLQQSLDRLGTDYIDLYYQHRVDPNTPVEQVFEVLKSLVEEGKIRYVGMSECTADELRRAHAVHPVTAIQMEWSLQTRDLEAEIVPAARELGVAIVAYSPLGRGMLTDAFKSKADLPEDDWRSKSTGRFNADNLQKNIDALAPFKEFAAKKNCTPAQLALAWVHAQGPDVFPIPGTKSSARVVQNAGAVGVELSPEEAQEVAAVVPEPEGERYAGMNATFNQRQGQTAVGNL